MAAEVKVRLSVEGAPEAIAAVRQFVQQSKRSGNEAASAFQKLNDTLTGFTKLAGYAVVTGLIAKLTQFELATIRAAAEQKDLAQALGSTIENFSTLSAVAKVTNTEQGKFVAGLGQLANRVDQLRSGVPDAVRGFARLGLSAKDFASNDIVVNAAKVAEAIDRLPPGASKGAIAVDALGKNARALLPTLQKLGELGGLEGATRFAKDLGLFLDVDTVSKLDQIATELQIIEARFQGAGIQLAKGLGPHAVLALRNLQTVMVDGKSSAEVLGEGIGFLARGMSELIVQTIAWGTVLGDVFTLKFAKAREDFEKFDKLLKEMRAQTAADVKADPLRNVIGAPSGSAASAQLAAAAFKKRADAELAYKRALENADETIDKQSLEKKLLSIQEYFDRRKKAYQADYEFREKLLQDELAAAIRANDQLAIETATFNLNALGQEGRARNAQLDADLADALSRAKEVVKETNNVIRDSIAGALTTFLATGIQQVRTLTDAFRQLGAAIANAVAQAAASKLVQSLPFIGTPAGKASGGLLRGPGTGTSDSIPLWGSTGEYIVRAAQVMRPGMLAHLEAINRGAVDPTLRSLAPRYAEGGLVDAPGVLLAGGGGSTSVGGQIQIGLEDGLMLRALETPAGQRVLLKIVSKNPRAFRAATGRP